MKFGRQLIVVTALLALAGCSGSTQKPSYIAKDSLENQMFARLTKELGHKPQRVACPGGLEGVKGSVQNCVLTDDGVDYKVTGTVTEVKGGNVSFEIATGEALTKPSEDPAVNVVGSDSVAESVSSQVTQTTGKTPDSVNCPNDLQAAQDATTVCYLHDGDKTYDVLVKVTSVQGDSVAYDIQVAGTPR